MDERLKNIRKALKLSQSEFGEVIGIQKSAVSKLERGETSLTNANIKTICREFDVNENWLRTGEGDMFVERTRNEQIASFVGSLQANADDSFKKRFISMLSALDDAEWEVLEKMAIKIYENKE